MTTTVMHSSFDGTVKSSGWRNYISQDRAPAIWLSLSKIRSTEEVLEQLLSSCSFVVRANSGFAA